MTNEEYWKEAISSSLDEIECKMTDLQIESMAKDMQTAHENIGLCFAPVENPLIDQMQRQKESHNAEIKRLERIQDECIQSICRKYNCEPTQVNFSEKGISISPVGRCFEQHFI